MPRIIVTTHHLSRGRDVSSGNDHSCFTSVLPRKKKKKAKRDETAAINKSHHQPQYRLDLTHAMPGAAQYVL